MKKCSGDGFSVFNFSFVYFFIFVYALLSLSSSTVEGIRWLSLYNSTTNWTDPSSCWSAHDSGALTSWQLRVCRKHPDAMPHVVASARLARDRCLYDFSLERWNCSTIDRAPDYSAELLTGTREQAYVYAMSSAALTWSIARACASGSLADCSCAIPPMRAPKPPKPFLQPRARFKWGGCGDNFKWADRFAKQFIDAYELAVKSGREYETNIAKETTTSSTTTQAPSTTIPPSVLLVDDQPQIDNRTSTRGRKRRPKGIKRKVKRSERSWEKRRKKDRKNFLRKLESRMAADDPRFDPMIDLDVRLRSLRQLIATANLANGRFGRKTVSSGMHTKCTCHGVSGSCSVRTCWRSLPQLTQVSNILSSSSQRATVLRSGGRAVRAKTSRLMYVSPSPDYCDAMPDAGSLGTQGRPCNASLGNEAGGCGRLCCGRGRRAVKQTKLERCRCRYEWCCRVKCDVCRILTVQHYCN